MRFHPEILMWRIRHKKPHNTSEVIDYEVVYMNELVVMLEPDETYFTHLLSQIKQANGTVVEWLEDEFMPRLTCLTEAEDLWCDWVWVG